MAVSATLAVNPASVGSNEPAEAVLTLTNDGSSAKYVQGVQTVVLIPPPPLIVVTGAPDDDYDVQVVVTSNGGRGQGTFKWSLDEGATWEEAGVTIPASGVYALGSTGLTVTFRVGTIQSTEQADFATTNAVGAVTATGAGTLPPVTVTGASVGLDYEFVVEITTAGMRGTAKFRWSLDGGSTWEEENVDTVASYALPDVGPTVEFPLGLYEVGDTYSWNVTGVSWGIMDAFGTSPPGPVSLNEAPLTTPLVGDFVISLASGGSPGTATFDWSFVQAPPGVVTNSGSGITVPTTPFEYVLDLDGANPGVYGAEVTFANGTYNADNEYLLTTDGVLSAVTAEGPGARTPPTLTAAGTATGSYEVELEILSSGALGAATFRWTDDAGASWSGTETVPGGGTFALPGTGVTVTFASGLYEVGDAYAFDTTASAGAVTTNTSWGEPATPVSKGLPPVGDGYDVTIPAGGTLVVRYGLLAYRPSVASESVAYSVGATVLLTDRTTVVSTLATFTVVG